MKIRFGWGRLDSNSHIMTKSDDGGYDYATRRSSASLVALGRDAWLKSEGRTVFGLRLWLYAPSGACVHFDACLVFAKSPCAPGSKYGPQDVAA